MQSWFLSMNPQAPDSGREFASLVESVVQSLKRDDVRTFHIVGSPTPPVRKHFDLTVDAPAVAVFNEGKLVGQFGEIRSKADLKKKLHEVLP
jgi:hypothetical protein